MGNRAEVIVYDSENGPVCLYTHWDAHLLAAHVQEALQKAEEKWRQPDYLARVVFSTMTKGDDSTLGFGISAGKGMAPRQIRLRPHNRLEVWNERRMVWGGSFQEYVNLERVPEW